MEECEDERTTSGFKAKVALEARHGDKTIQEIAARHKVHPNQVSAWKRQAMDGLGAVFSNGAGKTRVDREGEIHDLHAKIGQLTVERFFWPEGSNDEPGRAQGDDWARPSLSELELSKRPAFDPAVFIVIETFFDRKVEAFLSYTAQVVDYPHPRSGNALRARAQFWGNRVNRSMAEAFTVVRFLR
jgi:transposase